MKTLFLKNGMPAMVAVLAIAGAFATTSMQSVAKNDVATIVPGYFPNSTNGACDQPTQCSDVIKPQMCRVNGSSGPIGYEKDDQNNCIQPLYRIVNGQ